MKSFFSSNGQKNNLYYRLATNQFFVESSMLKIITFLRVLLSFVLSVFFYKPKDGSERNINFQIPLGLTLGSSLVNQSYKTNHQKCVKKNNAFMQETRLSSIQLEFQAVTLICWKLISQDKTLPHSSAHPITSPTTSTINTKSKLDLSIKALQSSFNLYLQSYHLCSVQLIKYSQVPSICQTS